MRRIAFLLATVWLAPLCAAHASNHSALSLGFGTSYGLIKTRGARAMEASELKARLRLLYVVGLELSFNPAGPQPTRDGQVYGSDLRASGLVYLVPTSPVGGYVKAGVGGSRLYAMDDVNDVKDETIGYHGGGGVELCLGEHLVLDGEFLLLIPGVATGLDAVGRSIEPVRRPSAKNFSLGFSLLYFF